MRPDPHPQSTSQGAPAASHDPIALTEAVEAARAEVDLTCQECAGPLAWSPDHRALRCEHCESQYPVETEDRTIVERAITDVPEAGRGYGIDLRVQRCDNCGARTAFGERETSGSCPFCGSARLLALEESRKPIRPESLVPLEMGRDRVETEVKSWIGRLWFRPNALQQVANFEATGLYVPAWTYDADVRSRWTAQSGTYYYVTRRVNGKTQRVRKVRWRPSSGRRRDYHDDVLVLASRGIPAKLAERLGQYDTGDLVPYRPEYLAGWRTEEYEVDLDAGWSVARGRIVELQRRACAADVPGDTHRALRVHNDISGVRWKHVLLPVWSLSYSFRGETYPVLVHGSTGRVVGEAPYSWVKIVFALLLAAVVIGGLILLVNLR